MQNACEEGLEDGSIDKSFEDSPIDTLSVEDVVAVYFDEAINTYTLIEDPRHGLIALPKSHAYVGRNSPRVL